MGYYRFMSTNHIKSTLEGKLRFRHFSYYRFLEILLGDEDDLIGDAEDGVNFVDIEKLELQGSVSQDMRAKLKQVGFHVEGDVNMVISNHVSINAMEGFLLSFSCGDLEELKRSMVNEDYNACVEFIDLNVLADHIYNYGIVDGFGPVSDHFDPPLVGDVGYANNRVFFEEMKGVDYTPFLKRKKFREQQESRIVLIPKQNFAGDLLSISVNFPEGYLVEKFRGDVKERATVEGMADPLGYLQEVAKVLKSLESYPSNNSLKSHGQYMAVAQDANYLKRKWLTTDGLRKKIAQAYWQLRESDSKYVDTYLERYLLADPTWDKISGFLEMFFVVRCQDLRSF